MEARIWRPAYGGLHMAACICRPPPIQNIAKIERITRRTENAKNADNTGVRHYSWNNVENRRREVYIRARIDEDPFAERKRKRKQKQRTMATPTMTTLQKQHDDLQSDAYRALCAASNAGLELINIAKKRNDKILEIAREYAGGGSWTIELTDRLAKLNGEFATLATEASQCQTTLDTLDRANAEASRLVNAKSLEMATARLENLKSELCELESERVQVEQNATGYSAELAKLDTEIRYIIELLQSARYCVRTQGKTPTEWEAET